MKRLSVILAIAACCTGSIKAFGQGSDPLAGLKRFSDFSKIDIRRLLDGEILSQRGPLMKFPNGISSQLCFAVSTTPTETVRRLQSWDPTRCESLKVYAAHGMSDPCVLKDFNALPLSLDSGRRADRFLLDQTLATTPGKSNLNLTQIEAAKLAACVGKDAGPKTVGSCWAAILLPRALEFQRKGFSAKLPYEFGEEFVVPASHLRSMLEEQVLVSREFAPLLQGAGLINSGARVSPIKPSYYWRLFEADHHGTLSLGAVYVLEAGAHYQLLETEYYVSGTYYTTATLYEIWPIRDGARTGSLVWCEVLCSAPILRFATGMERLASGVVLTVEVKKMIRCLQESLKNQ